MTKGEQYVLDDGTRIEVKRVAADSAWADLSLTQTGGASWSKRQPLRDGELPYDNVRNLSVWDGDGLPGYNDWRTFISVLDMTTVEIEGWIDSTKREAWIREKTAKHEWHDWNIAVARYFWRRTEMLIRYLKVLNAEMDEDSEPEA